MKQKTIKSYDFPFIIEAKSLLVKHPAGQLTITALELDVRISLFKLRIGYKQLLKVTITQYRLSLRLNMAQKFLAETDLTNSEIASKTGLKVEMALLGFSKETFRELPENSGRVLPK